MTEMVATVERAGYVVRHRDPLDGRASLAALTAAGRDCLRDCWRIAQSVARPAGRYIAGGRTGRTQRCRPGPRALARTRRRRGPLGRRRSRASCRPHRASRHGPVGAEERTQLFRVELGFLECCEVPAAGWLGEPDDVRGPLEPGPGRVGDIPGE